MEGVPQIIQVIRPVSYLKILVLGIPHKNPHRNPHIHAFQSLLKIKCPHFQNCLQDQENIKSWAPKPVHRRGVAPIRAGPEQKMERKNINMAKQQKSHEEKHGKNMRQKSSKIYVAPKQSQASGFFPRMSLYPGMPRWHGLAWMVDRMHHICECFIDCMGKARKASSPPLWVPHELREYRTAFHVRWRRSSEPLNSVWLSGSGLLFPCLISEYQSSCQEHVGVNS